jgi:hypothetical protein
MQIVSKDKKLLIEIMDDPYRLPTLPQTDFSIVEGTNTAEPMKHLYDKLHKTQAINHVSLVVMRQPRKNRLKAFAALVGIEETGFRYYDHVSIVSQTESKKSAHSLTQLGEVAVMFTKTDEINKSASEWFRPDVGDCSNVWDVTPQEEEFFVKSTAARKMCIETLALMANCASPLVARRFLIIGTPESTMAEFAHKFNLTMCCYTSDEIAARRVVKHYEKYLDGKKEAE